MDAIASPHPSGATGDAPPVLTSPALTGLHAGQHRDRLLPAASVPGPEIEALGNRLIAACRAGSLSGRDCAREIGGFIAARARPLPPRHVALIAAVGAWLDAAFNPEVGDLAGAAGCSPRQVQRLVERYFGLPPRALARKYRALRAAALLAGPQLSLAEEAARAEALFDQSPMMREIVRFIGRTPARLADKATPCLAEMIAPTNLRELEV